MASFKSEDGKSSIELIKTDYSDGNGSKTYGFTCKASSRGFVAKIENIWFYEEDLLKFHKDINNLISNFSIKSKVELQAMSEFNCVVEPKDFQGHFNLTVYLDDLFYKNSARVNIELETQTLINFSEDLRSQIDIR